MGEVTHQAMNGTGARAKATNPNRMQSEAIEELRGTCMSLSYIKVLRILHINLCTHVGVVGSLRQYCPFPGFCDMLGRRVPTSCFK